MTTHKFHANYNTGTATLCGDLAAEVAYDAVFVDCPACLKAMVLDLTEQVADLKSDLKDAWAVADSSAAAIGTAVSKAKTAALALESLLAELD